MQEATAAPGSPQLLAVSLEGTLAGDMHDSSANLSPARPLWIQISSSAAGSIVLRAFPSPVRHCRRASLHLLSLLQPSGLATSSRSTTSGVIFCCRQHCASRHPPILSSALCVVQLFQILPSLLYDLGAKDGLRSCGLLRSASPAVSILWPYVTERTSIHSSGGAPKRSDGKAIGYLLIDYISLNFG